LPGTLDDKLFLHIDRPGDDVRLTYVRLDGQTVTAFIQFIPTEPVDGEMCFSVGWAVPEELRGQGRAAEAFLVALKEMREGFSQKVNSFWIEGIVEMDNLASQRVAARVISASPKPSVDGEAGVPILQYLRHIDASTQL
jgi:RimJ/RimL family protein N-acetyltransferase